VTIKTYRQDGNLIELYSYYHPEASMAGGPTLVQQMWDLLDARTAELMKPVPDEEILTTRGQARGIAQCLALFMQPHFSTADDVVREAVKRYKAKQEGTDYETPGLGSRSLESPPLFIAPRRTGTATKKAANPSVSDADKASILKAKGVFPADDLAKIYKVSVEVINQIWGVA